MNSELLINKQLLLSKPSSSKWHQFKGQNIFPPDTYTTWNGGHFALLGRIWNFFQNLFQGYKKLSNLFQGPLNFDNYNRYLNEYQIWSF